MIPDHPLAAEAVPAEPFLLLLYRYFWPFAYFRDVSRGKRLERQLNYRYNRAMRVHLPGFAFKWVFLAALCFSAGIAVAGQAALVLLTAFLFATGVSALTVSLVALTAWCWLSRFPELF